MTSIVHRQVDAGITQVGDGEFGKASAEPVDFGAWWSYSFSRFSGLSRTQSNAWNSSPAPRADGALQLTSFRERRDRQRFADFYSELNTGRIASIAPSVTGRVSYTGHTQVASDIANLQAATDAAGTGSGFLTSVAPGVAARLSNHFYESDEAHVWAWAEALREEYRAIIDAGLILQIDDPSMAENWDAINPEPTVEAYVAFTRVRVDALNWALRGLPEDRIRFHLCWGSWHGPHTTDLEFRHIAELMLQVNAGAYSFEAGNPRHEHEWRIWEDLTLPDEKLLLPGVVGHSSPVVEHPELVAERITRFASLVGSDRVIASTDCGLGGRIHADIAWAKLEALVEGSRLAHVHR
ncbi:cobalamin-independent methionine synthase II family protein [Microbacterium sp. HD4P20]|uniref:cobalamin-independent methionine synthase II family protein n=1 Tax=Microbacterium sp. HD4P20 TaxID=2864874 RepID=UPI0027E29737|nr:cobalamin-independent methionine synthase II family protein [Microbacterium sp. HD4P20]